MKRKNTCHIRVEFEIKERLLLIKMVNHLKSMNDVLELLLTENEKLNLI